MRAAAATIATAVLAVLAAGCGGSPGTPSSAASTQENGALAWSHSMRSNGVANLPDQTRSTIKIPSAQQFGVSTSQLQAAEAACQHLLPNGGQPPNQAEQQRQLSGMRRFSRCMRSHGISSWHDPTIGSDGKPGFNPVGIQGIPDQSSPQFQTRSTNAGDSYPNRSKGFR
ncbi:MAG: hypothetical protein ACRDQZ_26950 [Mycobacteriales bacterium]